MKLMRYGAKGAEKPALVDAKGQLRDLSGELTDISAAPNRQIRTGKLRWPAPVHR